METIPNSRNLVTKIFVAEKTKSKNQVTTKQALTNLFRFFRLTGIYSNQDYKYAYYCYCLILHGCVTCFLPIAFVASYFSQSNQNLDYSILFSSIQTGMSTFGSLGKTLMLIVLVPKLLTTETIMTELDERCVSEDEVALLVKLKKLCNKLVIIYAMTFWSYSLTAIICAILAGHPPYSMYLPFVDWRQSKWEFVVACFIEFMLVSIACFEQVSNDSYGAIYVSILRAHMNILCLRIRKLCSNPDTSLDENFEELKKCIKDHKNIIQLYEIISSVISITISLQFAISAAILGVSLTNIFIFATDIKSVISACFYILAVVVEIFPLCFYANCLIDDCNKLPDEIFHSSWIQQSPRYRKMLIFFIQRSQQTMELWAGKIFPINLNSFISIAKFSFSIYTLIIKMGIKEKFGFE